MAIGETILKIKMLVDASQASAGLDKASGKVATVGDKFKSVGKAAVTGLAVGAVVAFGKSAVTAATESARETAKLEAVFKSMGDTTGTAAKAANDYATALSNKTGIDDEAITAGQALLATFSNVSGEAGRSAGIFDRATAAGADLAAAGFGSINTNAVQLGKALQDPTKGITALAKSGVTFTDAQKKQIKVMQESGDVLGAQKIVLAGVESQVKGTAEATGTAADKQAVAYGNMQEAIGAKLLPVINKLMEKLTVVIDFVSANSNWLVPLAIGVGVFVLALKGYLLVADLIRNTNIRMAASWLVAYWPVLLIIAAIAAVIVIFVLLYQKCAWFRDAVQAVMKAASAAFNWVVDAAKAVFNWIKSNWPTLLAILTGPIGIAVLLISKNWDTIKNGAKAVIDFIGRMASAIGSALSGVAQAIARPFIEGFDAVKRAVQAAIDWISDKITWIKGIVSTGIQGAKDVYNKFARAWNAFEIAIPEKKVGPVKIPGTGITWGLPDIPTLAAGGYTTRATLAVIGEGRGGEFAAPEPLLRRLIREEAGGGVTLNVNVPATANPAETGREVAKVLRSYFSAGGRLSVPG